MSFRAGGHSAVTDQFKRAAMSIPLNIAEGAGIKGSNSYITALSSKLLVTVLGVLSPRNFSSALL